MKKIFALIFVFVVALCLLTACKDEGVIERADGFVFYEELGTLITNVDNATEVIDLSAKFAVTEGYTWKLYSDKEHTSEVDKTKVSLNVGENVFYFVMYDEDVVYSECIINIKRSEGIKIEENNGSLTGSIDIGELLD